MVLVAAAYWRIQNDRKTYRQRGTVKIVLFLYEVMSKKKNNKILIACRFVVFQNSYIRFKGSWDYYTGSEMG